MRRTKVLCVATDGDRGYMKYHEGLFALCFHRLHLTLDQICDYVFYSRETTFPVWWIGDLLRALKCQRCRLLKRCS
jgi:hypothetical protein